MKGPGVRVPSPALSGRGRRGLLRPGRGDRRLDHESRALRVVRLRPDPAVEAAHELAADVEPEPGPADAAGHVRVEPEELLEDAAPLGRRDAETLVAHLPAHAAILAPDVHR